MGSVDSTGKQKFAEARARRSTVISFALGLALGVLCSGLYVRQHSISGGNSQLQSPRKLSSVDPDRSDISSSSTTTTAVTDVTRSSSAPRSELEELLLRIAPTKELIAAVSNKNYLWGTPPMLKTFTDGFKRANIKNHLVLALDEPTKRWCDENEVNAYLLKLEVHKAQEGTGENHAVSAMKFGILKPFIDLGWSVLLSDVDIAILQNPFDHLYRDSDVEGMTDGFDEQTSYGAIEGFDDPSMGWARYAQYYKHFNLNSGLFYLRANNRTSELMKRLDDRLRTTKYWDQTAYNEEIFFLSHGSYKSPQVTVRVMDIDKFMNSKRLFKITRNIPKERQPPMPVTVHINYHPDKHERMLAVVKYYVDGDDADLKKFPGGSEPGSK